MNVAADAPCPCGRLDARGRPLLHAACCGPWLAGAPAPDAEALMRSRYCAFVLQDAPYLLATWHASTRPTALDLDKETSPRWLGLDIKRHQATGPDSAVVDRDLKKARAAG